MTASELVETRPSRSYEVRQVRSYQAKLQKRSGYITVDIERKALMVANVDA